MSIKNLYEAIGGNYNDVVSRFGSAETVAHFVERFLTDDSFTLLETAMAKKDAETAFRAAHTLKGVARNLGFSDLGDSASNITEALRASRYDDACKLFGQVKADYDKIVTVIKSVAADKN